MFQPPGTFSKKRARELHLPVLLTLLDLTGIVLGLLFAYWIRFHSALMSVTKGYDPAEYKRMFPIATAVWLVSFCLAHLYRRNEKIWSWRVFGRLLRGSLLAVAIFVAILFFVRSLTVHGLARWMVPISFVTVVGLVSFGRSLLGRNLAITARALVLGAGPSGKEVARSIRRHPELGWEIVGFITTEPADLGRELTGIEVTGTVGDLPGILDREEIEAVFVAQTDFRREMLGDVFFECQKRMVDVKVVPDLTEMLFSEVDVGEVDGIPFLGLRDTSLRGWNAVLKRLFDAAGAVLLLIPAAPAMAVIAWLIKRDSPGPVFYRQERVGADGKRFLLAKFRTMRADAEKGTGPIFATPDDPRQTRIGRWLRQAHLDEIPQLWNVLTGDMSLVGPRPERPFFVEQFREQIPRYMARHRIKSGITGWAQVNGQTGHEGTISERLRYDLYYIENWSILFDIKVLLLTVVWMARRIRQLMTLPPDHPALRRSEDLPVDGGSPERGE